MPISMGERNAPPYDRVLKMKEPRYKSQIILFPTPSISTLMPSSWNQLEIFPFGHHIFFLYIKHVEYKQS